jgi:hypothetical protein
MQLTYPAEQKYASLLFYLLRERGIHIYDNRAFVLTTAHSDADLAHLVRAFRESLSALQSGGFLPASGLAAQSSVVLGTLWHPPSHDDQPALALADRVDNRTVVSLPKKTHAEMRVADFLAGGEERPPVPGARKGRDPSGNEGWFVPDPDRPGKYLQVRERS